MKQADAPQRPDTQIDLAAINVTATGGAPAQAFRALVRDSSGIWYISQTLINIGQAGNAAIDLSISGWLEVDTQAQADINQLDADTKTPIGDIATLNALLLSLKENGYPNAYPRTSPK